MFRISCFVLKASSLSGILAVAVFEGPVVEQVVKFLAGLHQVENVGLRAFAGEKVQGGFGRLTWRRGAA